MGDGEGEKHKGILVVKTVQASLVVGLGLTVDKQVVGPGPAAADLENEPYAGSARTFVRQSALVIASNLVHASQLPLFPLFYPNVTLPS